MSRIIYSKENTNPTCLSEVDAPETEQILHLKRLLVTLKQHYEKSLNTSQIQLQEEQNQRIALQIENRNLHAQLLDSQKLYDEDLQALGGQQILLKDLLKKTQEELNLAKQQKDELTHFSNQIKQEFEGMRLGLTQELKTLENRYIEVLNEKIGLEYQFKELQLNLEIQNTLQNEKKILEMALQSKESDFSKNLQITKDLQIRFSELSERAKENEFIQDKYEQLQEEWKQLKESLEENIILRRRAEQIAKQLEADLIKTQILQEEKNNLETEKEQLKISFNDSESRLKVAQQHLAKKVKETALLNEKVEVQHLNLKDMTQTLDQQRNQILQLQSTVDHFQKQEKRLQDQLNETLKSSESQIKKWEEKYFHMYDKWQESENKIRDLKLIEEKYNQMQNMVANLGNFMGRPHEPFLEKSTSNDDDEKYDLFGMPQPHEKYKVDLSA